MEKYKNLKEKLETILTLPELPFEEDLTAVDCKQMYDILCKIERGTLKEFPCKVGDTIYFAYDFGNECIGLEKGEVICIKCQKDGIYFHARYKIGLYWHKIEDIDKTIFFTSEKAEKIFMENQINQEAKKKTLEIFNKLMEIYKDNPIVQEGHLQDVFKNEWGIEIASL